MFDSNIAVLDRRSGKIRDKICPDAAITLSSKVRQWQDLKVEQQCLPPSETPPMTSIGHLVCVHLSAPLSLEYREDDHWQHCIMHPGDLFIIPDGSFHAARWQQSGELLAIALPPETFNKFAPEAVRGREIELIPYRGKPDRLVTSLALAFQEELEGDSAGQLYRDSLTNALVARLLRNYSVCMVKESSGKLSQHKLKLVDEYIQVHIEREIGLNDLAAVAGLSQFHFSRVFKETVGVSPNQYVNRCRIEKAKQMLHQRQIKIGRVATACGYRNLSYFVRQFRKVTGVTPGVYQNK